MDNPTATNGKTLYFHSPELAGLKQYYENGNHVTGFMPIGEYRKIGLHEYVAVFYSEPIIISLTYSHRHLGTNWCRRITKLSDGKVIEEDGVWNTNENIWIKQEDEYKSSERIMFV